MNRSLPQLLHIFLPLLFLQALPEAFAQTSSFPLKEWVKKLDLKKDADNQNFLSINPIHCKEYAAMSGAYFALLL